MKASIFLRLIFGPLIFISPVIVTIVNLLLDGFDGELYKRSGYARPQYSMYDKILDYWWYIWVMIYVLATNVPAKDVFIVLFIYRTLGQILFLLFHNGIILFLFPNIFELVFFYYLLAHAFHAESTFMSGQTFMFAMGILSLIGFSREIIIHLKQMNFSGVYLGKTSYWPLKTSNPYKAFLFFSLLLAVAVTLNQLTLTKQADTYITRASKATRQGSIISYNKSGIIIGTTTARTMFAIDLVRAGARSGQSMCHAQNIQVFERSTDDKFRTFVWSSACLADLANGAYTVFIKATRTSSETLIGFDITNGSLSR